MSRPMNSFGNSVNHDRHFLTALKPTRRDESVHEHIKKSMAVQERIIQIAQTKQEERDIYVIAERSKSNPYTTSDQFVYTKDLKTAQE